MNTHTIVAIGLGILGTITGIISLVWNIIRDRPKIRINILGVNENKLLAQIINVRSHPIKLNYYGITYIDYTNNRHLQGMSIIINERDRTLQGRDNCYLDIDKNLLKGVATNKQLRRFFVVDAEQREYQVRISNNVKHQIYE